MKRRPAKTVRDGDPAKDRGPWSREHDPWDFHAFHRRGHRRRPPPGTSCVSPRPSPSLRSDGPRHSDDKHRDPRGHKGPFSQPFPRPDLPSATDARHGFRFPAARYVAWRLRRVLFWGFGGMILMTALVLHGIARAFDLHDGRRPPWVVFVVALAALWGASGFLARRLTRPLGALLRAADAFGRGDLTVRVPYREARHGEAFVIAKTFNDMASRIERQIADQRALLATVSHEIRSPLARIRMHTELARDAFSAPSSDADAAGSDAVGTAHCTVESGLGRAAAEFASRLRATAGDRHLKAVDDEVVAVDKLVGDLLAGSRIDFGALARTPHAPVELAMLALEAVGDAVPPEVLAVDGSDAVGTSPRIDGSDAVGTSQSGRGDLPMLAVDVTLVVRALANLLQNARRHGGGVTAFTVGREGENDVFFQVRDDGPGIPDGDEARIFEPFYRSAVREGAEVADATRGEAPSTGLGLALVRRIVEAHGGTVTATNAQSDGGPKTQGALFRIVLPGSGA